MSTKPAKLQHALSSSFVSRGQGYSYMNVIYMYRGGFKNWGLRDCLLADKTGGFGSGHNLNKCVILEKFFENGGLWKAQDGKVGSFGAVQAEKVGSFGAHMPKNGGLYRSTYPYRPNMGVSTRDLNAYFSTIIPTAVSSVILVSM